ncbi:hypothetical protein COO91_04774 [Nostoc flagelliforme CCNUN1]|uniref:Uncharacterized protein n=1 Tax=Nostoc flagelliforme CCNUN1 TaxID=2038116 RepID=A0A2K8STL5_9NOSO|nr:hypothetical protein COO91_04774 [Nostoc flagelliforme CCNUN1]
MIYDKQYTQVDEFRLLFSTRGCANETLRERSTLDPLVG